MSRERERWWLPWDVGAQHQTRLEGVEDSDVIHSRTHNLRVCSLLNLSKLG